MTIESNLHHFMVMKNDQCHYLLATRNDLQHLVVIENVICCWMAIENDFHHLLISIMLRPPDNIICFGSENARSKKRKCHLQF
jgi:hypothetical protein